MKRLKNTKPKAKPNGWEQDFDKEFDGYVFCSPNDNDPGLYRLKHFIHQAILSAEERAREVIIKRVNSMKPAIGEGFRELGVVTPDDLVEVEKYNRNINEVIEVIKTLSLPDQVN